jgi:hypothetical protein
MIRKFGLLVLGLAFAALISAPVVAEEKKEVTLEGTITCPKCDLGIADKCGTVIKLKEKDKDVIYTFDADSNKKYHGDICKAPKEGKVTGTVTKDGDKMMISVTKLEYKK